MNLLNQDGKPMCMIYSAAMALGITPEEIIKEIGHDGTEIKWPSMTGNNRLRGVSIQEIIDLALKRNIALVCLDAYPHNSPSVATTDSLFKTFLMRISRIHNIGVLRLEIQKVVDLIRQLPEPSPVFSEEEAAKRFKANIEGKTAILLGEKIPGIQHVVAWDGFKCYDPNGFNYPLEEFMIKEAWIVFKIKS